MQLRRACKIANNVSKLCTMVLWSLLRDYESDGDVHFHITTGRPSLVDIQAKHIASQHVGGRHGHQKQRQEETADAHT